MASWIPDLRATLRSLRRAPTFVVTAVLVLGLGIGLATAVFSVVRAVLLRPLPVADESRIVLPHIVDARGIDQSLVLEEYRQLPGLSRTMSAIAGEAHQGAFGLALREGDRPVVLRAAWVTGNFFDVLGVRPALGRLFHTADESVDEASVMVLSYDTWRRHFGGDPAIVGRKLTSPYTQHTYTIIGVAPAGLDYPAGVEYWSPTVYGGGLDVIARLAPGASPAAAGEEFGTIMREIHRQRPDRDLQAVAGVRVRTLPEVVLGDVRPVLRLLGAGVALLLLLACVNVGNLLLLRFTRRGHEIAVRRSLGASTTDIVRPLAVEGGLLALLGGAVGILLSVLVLRILLRVAPAGLPRLDVIRLGGVSVAGAVGLTVLAALVVGVLPVLASAGRDLAPRLRIDPRAGGETRARRRLRHGFVAVQIALAVVLLAGAGLLTRSLARLETLQLGYRPDHLSLVWIATPVTRANADARFAGLLERVPPGLRAIPGVSAVTPMVIPPFFGSQVFNALWEVEGATTQPGAYPRIPIEAGDADYFRTLGIPLVRGRGFLESDRATSPGVAVVSERAAQLLGLGPDPIGRRIRFAHDTSAGAWRTVVGVAGDIHYRNLREAAPTIYLPSAQYFFQGLFAIRTTGSLEAVLPAVRRAVHEADPAALVARTEQLDQLVARQRALPTLSSLLLSGLGLVALALAAIGLYGLMASLVRAQTRELGVRLALGATPARLRRGVLTRAVAVAGLGAVAGLAGAVAGSHLVAALLFQISPTDPWTLGGVCVVLLGVTLVAAYLPARRATRIDPAEALRAE